MSEAQLSPSTLSVFCNGFIQVIRVIRVIRVITDFVLVESRSISHIQS